MDKSFMHQSLHALHCPQCGTLYTNSQIGVIQESEANILATITCAKCQHQSVVTLSLGTTQSIGLTGDLRSAEISRFANVDPVSTDELLDIFDYLKKAKGNFAHDFRQAATTPAAKTTSSARKSSSKKPQ